MPNPMSGVVPRGSGRASSMTFVTDIAEPIRPWVWGAPRPGLAHGSLRQARRPAARTKLTFKEQRELDALPAQIDALEDELRALESRLASADFYRGPASEVQAAADRLPQLQREIDDAYTRWHELESRVANPVESRSSE